MRHFNIKKLLRSQPDLNTPVETIWQEDGTRVVTFKANKKWAHQVRKQWQDYVSHIPPYPDRYKGRGIVICAGGLKYFTCAWVNINVLRKKGCTLPIEVWYAEGELTKETIGQLETLNVTCKNIKDHTDRPLTGFSLKPFAIIHSAFQEVMYLDADNTCLTDPGYLFDSPEFQSHGTLFWPDFWMTDPANPIWEVIDTREFQSMEQESGQLLVDKQKCWKELNLCLFFNLHPEYYYKMLFGDKDTFRFAWLALRTPYYMISKPVGFCGFSDSRTTIVFGGQTMVQHDPKGEIVFLHRNFLKWDVTKDDELIWRTIKRFKTNKANAKKKMIKFTITSMPDSSTYYGFDLEGDIEVLDFQQLYGDFEASCIQILQELRRSGFYTRFMLHIYFTYFKPGYQLTA